MAEVMLQQTQVDRVVPRWERFLDRWPDATSCAVGSVADVLTEWSGLGYPRRARDLHGAAVVVRDRHGGQLPDDLDALLDLPGVGPYTARAVLAFAFEADVAVVDTNVGRVLARRAGARLTPRAAQAAADAWVPVGEGWAWNQGMLDLGALRCRPTAPECAGCPVRRTCAWARAGRPEPDPAAGSAGVSRRQAPFEGSARQARGRLMRALGEGPVAESELAGVTGRDPAAARAVAESLVADGLARRGPDGSYALPH